MKQIKQMKRDARLQPDQEVSFIVENLKLLTALAQPNFRPQIDLLVTKSYDSYYFSLFLEKKKERGRIIISLFMY